MSTKIILLVSFTCIGAIIQCSDGDMKKVKPVKILVRSANNMNVDFNKNESSGTHSNYSMSVAKEFLLNKTEEQLFIGQLVKNIPFDQTLPDRYCLEDNNLWLGAAFRLGRLNIFFQKEIPDDLLDKTVIVSGVKKKSLNDKITLYGPCDKKIDVLQFRDDWYSDEGGYFTSHKQLDSVEYIEATDIVPIELMNTPPPLPLPRKGISIKEREKAHSSQPGEVLKIDIQNPLSIALEKLRIVIHYEGGPRKSLPIYKLTVLSLLPGELKTVTCPSQIEEEWKHGEYSLWYYHSAYIIDMKGPIEFLGPPKYKINL